MTRNCVTSLAVMVVSIGAASIGPGAGALPTAKRAESESTGATVVRVIDGDTIKVRLEGGRRLSVRLLGIDAPEVYPDEECWGLRAAGATERLLARGTKVRLISDETQANRDRYGRLLRYVIKGRSRDVGRVLVWRGHAKVYVHKRPFDRVRNYRRVEAFAQRDDRGLWGCDEAPQPVAPTPTTPAPAGDLNSYPPATTYACPASAPIKGNESSMIYHPPDSPWYAQTTPEQCFASEAGAVAHGFRRAIY